MEFEWDDLKEYDNIQKHGIRFSTAEHVFDDPLRIERRDDDSSDTEERW